MRQRNEGKEEFYTIHSFHMLIYIVYYTSPTIEANTIEHLSLCIFFILLILGGLESTTFVAKVKFMIKSFFSKVNTDL